MVNLVPVDIAKVGTTPRAGRRGRVSYPIIKAFLESGHIVVKVDPASTDKDPAYLRSVLNSYVTRHKIPVKLFSEAGELHLMRIDLTAEGEIDPDWVAEVDVPTEGATGSLRDLEAKPITPDVVVARAATAELKSQT